MDKNSMRIIKIIGATAVIIHRYKHISPSYYTNEHYDEGGIICQQKCPVLPGDTPEELAQRIHRLEYEYYPKVIEELVEGLSPSYL